MSNTTIKPNLPVKPRDINAEIIDRKKLNVKEGTFIQLRDETRRSGLGLPDIKTLYEKDSYFNEALKSEESKFIEEHLPTLNYEELSQEQKQNFINQQKSILPEYYTEKDVEHLYNNYLYIKKFGTEAFKQNTNSKERKQQLLESTLSDFLPLALKDYSENFIYHFVNGLDKETQYELLKIGQLNSPIHEFKTRRMWDKYLPSSDGGYIPSDEEYENYTNEVLKNSEKLSEGDEFLIQEVFAPKSRDNIISNHQQEISKLENELLALYNSGEEGETKINELFDSLASNYMYHYKAFEGDEELENFTIQDKIKYIAEAQIVSNSVNDPTLMLHSFDKKMQNYISDQQDWWDKTCYTAQGLVTGTVSLIVQGGLGLYGLGVKMIDGDEAYAEFMDSKVVNLWNDIEKYNTFNEGELAKARKWGISAQTRIKRVGEEFDFWSVDTIFETLDMGKYILSGMTTGGIGSALGKGVGWLGKVAKVTNKIQQGSKLYNTLNFANKLMVHSSQTLPMVQTMAKGTFDETLQEINSQIDTKIEKEIENLALQNKTELLQEYLNSDEISIQIEEAIAKASREYDRQIKASNLEGKQSLSISKNEYLLSVRNQLMLNIYKNAESNILNIAKEKYGEELKNKYAEEREMAKIAAGKAAQTTATLTWLKEGAFNLAMGQWMFSEGNRFKFNNKPKIKYNDAGEALPTKTSVTLGNKALIVGKTMGLKFGDEYLDSQIEAFSLGLGLHVQNDLIEGTYDPRGFLFTENGFVNFMSAAGSGMKSVANNLTSDSAIYEGLIGMVSGISPHINLNAIYKSKASYAQEMGRDSWKNLTFKERLNKYATNEILNDIIQTEREIEQAKLNAEYINKTIQKQGKDAFDIHLLISGLEKQQRAINEGKLIDAKDAKTRSGFELAHLVRNLDIVNSPQIQTLIQDIERLSKGDITEDDVKKFLFRGSNSGETQKLDEATAKAKIQENAIKLKTLFKDVNNAYKELESSKAGKNLNPITKKQLVYNKIYDKDVTNRLNSIEKAVSGNNEFSSNSVEEADYSTIAGFKATKKAQQEIVEDLKKKTKEIEESETKEGLSNEEKVLKTLADKLRLGALKEALELEEEYLAELSNKESEYQGSTRVLSEQEILALNPIQRAKMLNTKNINNYSKEQQKLIKQTINNLQKKNPDLLNDIKDAGELYQRRELNNKAYDKVLNNEDVYLGYVDLMVNSFKERSIRASENIILEQNSELLNKTSDKNLKKIIFDNKMSYALVRDYTEKNPERKDVLESILDVLKLHSDTQDFIDNSITLSPELKETLKQTIYPIIRKARSSKSGMKALDNLIDQLDNKENIDVKKSLEELLANLEQLNHQRDAKIVDKRKKRQAELEEKRKKIEEQKKNKSLEGKKKLLDNLFSETSEKEGIKTTKFRMFRKSKDGTVKTVTIGGPSISLSGKIAKEIKDFEGNENVDLTDIQILARRQDTTSKNKIQSVDIQYRIKYSDSTKSSWIKATVSLPSDFDVAKDIFLESNQIALANEYRKQSSSQDISKDDVVVDNSQPTLDVDLGVDGDGEAISPSLQEQTKAEDAYKVQEIITDVTNEDNTLNQDENSMLGIPFTHYNSEMLKLDGYMVPNDRSPKRGNAIDYAYEFYALVDKLGLNIADVIDYELPAILKENPDIQVHFMMTPLESTSQDVVFNAIEYTDAVKKYHPNDNDLIYSGGKYWLVIGSSFANTNNYINLINTLKKKRFGYFNYNPTEDYYISDAYTQVKETGSGRRVRRLEGEEETTQRKISELLYDRDNYNEQRNPYKLGNPKNKRDAYNNLKWIIQKAKDYIPVGTKTNDEIIPLSRPSENKGSVFILVPTTNNKLIPLYINPSFYKNIKGSELEEVINSALADLANPNLEGRKNAKDRLRELLVFDEEDNILIGEVNGKPALRIKRNNTVVNTFFLGKDGNFNLQDFIIAISELNPRINITVSTLKNPSMMEMYDDAGVLTTDLAILGTRNGSYSTYAVDTETGKPIIDDESFVSNYNTDIKNSVNSKTRRIAYDGKQYSKVDEIWRDDNDIVITDAELILKLEYREFLKDKTPDYSDKGFNYYIIDDSSSESIVVEEGTKGNLNILNKEESANRIDIINKAKEAEAQRKAAAEFVDLETSENNVKEENTEINVEQQLQGNFDTPTTKTTPQTELKIGLSVTRDGFEALDNSIEMDDYRQQGELLFKDGSLERRMVKKNNNTYIVIETGGRRGDNFTVGINRDLTIDQAMELAKKLENIIRFDDSKNIVTEYINSLESPNTRITKEVTKSTESSKSNEEKSLKELQNTKDLTTFEAIISKMSTRKKLKEIFKEKEWPWSNNTSEMANFLISKKVSINNISNVDTWLDIIKNCR